MPTVLGEQKSNDIVGENAVCIRYLSHGTRKKMRLLHSAREGVSQWYQILLGLMQPWNIEFQEPVKTPKYQKYHTKKNEKKRKKTNKSEKKRKKTKKRPPKKNESGEVPTICVL